MVIHDWDSVGEIVKCKDRQSTWGAEIAKNKVGPSKTMAPRDPETVDTIPVSAPTDVEDNLNPTYRQLVDAIEGKAELTIKPEQALRVVKVMEASFESAKTKNAINTEI